MTNVFDLHTQGKALTKQQESFIARYTFATRYEDVSTLESHYRGDLGSGVESSMAQWAEEETVWHNKEHPYDGYYC